MDKGFVLDDQVPVISFIQHFGFTSAILIIECSSSSSSSSNQQLLHGFYQELLLMSIYSFTYIFHCYMSLSYCLMDILVREKFNRIVEQWIYFSECDSPSYSLKDTFNGQKYGVVQDSTMRPEQEQLDFCWQWIANRKKGVSVVLHRINRQGKAPIDRD